MLVAFGWSRGTRVHALLRGYCDRRTGLSHTHRNVRCPPIADTSGLGLLSIIVDITVLEGEQFWRRARPLTSLFEEGAPHITRFGLCSKSPRAGQQQLTPPP